MRISQLYYFEILMICFHDSTLDRSELEHKISTNRVWATRSSDLTAELFFILIIPDHRRKKG